VGIADMQARLAQLREQKRVALDTFATGSESVTESRLAELNHQIREAEDRLAEYNLQQEGLN
jgi:hypothetical protein